MKIIKVNEFSTRLRWRTAHQGGGDDHAHNFRKTYLKDLDSQEWWDDKNKKITLDFEGVKTLGPGFANEAFAYFGIYNNVNWKKFKEKVILKNISKVKKDTIERELKSGTGEE